MFWENLLESESERYMVLTKKIKPWIMWRSLSKKKQAEESEPEVPTDAELIEVEMLNRKGWMTHGHRQS